MSMPSSTMPTTTDFEPVKPASQAFSAWLPNWFVVPAGPEDAGESSPYMPHSWPLVV